jgi:hypothetical protein
MKTIKKSTLKKINIALVSLLMVVLVGTGLNVAKMSSGSDLWSSIASIAGNILGNNLSEKVEAPVLSGMLGSAGDTYQTAKVYSKVISSGTTVPASIACNGWLITGVDFYVTPSSTASATTTISLGTAATAATTTLLSTIDSDTFSTSTAVYMTSSTAEGAGITCSATQYINAVFGAAATTTNGVLNVEYLIYQ